METTKTTKKQSPNLLNKDLFDQNPTIEKIHIDISLASKILVIATQMIFVALIGYNSKVLNDIKGLEKNVSTLTTELNDKKQTIDEIGLLIRKSEKLKSLESQRVRVTKKFQNTIRLLPTGTKIRNSSFEEGSLGLTIETQDVLGVSILMSNYFSEDLADRIIIRSANLNTISGVFTTNMEIILK